MPGFTRCVSAALQLCYVECLRWWSASMRLLLPLDRGQHASTAPLCICVRARTQSHHSKIPSISIPGAPGQLFASNGAALAVYSAAELLCGRREVITGGMAHVFLQHEPSALHTRPCAIKVAKELGPSLGFGQLGALRANPDGAGGGCSSVPASEVPRDSFAAAGGCGGGTLMQPFAIELEVATRALLVAGAEKICGVCFELGALVYERAPGRSLEALLALSRRPAPLRTGASEAEVQLWHA